MIFSNPSTNWHLSQWKKFRFSPTATSSKTEVEVSQPPAPDESTIVDPDAAANDEPSPMERLRREMPDLYRVFPSRFQQNDSA